MTSAQVTLEPAAQEFADAAAQPPQLYELTPDDARKALDDIQAAPIDKLPVDDEWVTVPAKVGILAGTVGMEIQGQPTLTLRAGDPFLMPPRTPHNAIDLGPETGQMLSTYLVEVDQPLAEFTG